MKKIAVILSAVVLLASCVGRNDVNFTGLKSADLQLPSAVHLKLGVENRSGSRLHLLSADFDMQYKGRKAVTVRLAEPVTVDRKFSGDVPVNLRFKFTDPMAGFALMGRLEEAGNDITVSGKMVVKAGIQKKTIKLENEPLPKLMALFGISKYY